MKSAEMRAEAKPASSFPRLYCGEETDERNGVPDYDRDWPPQPLDAEAEMFWAGRSPAARHSARVAA